MALVSGWSNWESATTWKSAGASGWTGWESATTWKSAWRLVTSNTPIILTPHLVT